MPCGVHGHAYPVRPGRLARMTRRPPLAGVRRVLTPEPTLNIAPPFAGGAAGVPKLVPPAGAAPKPPPGAGCPKPPAAGAAGAPNPPPNPEVVPGVGAAGAPNPPPNPGVEGMGVCPPNGVPAADAEAPKAPGVVAGGAGVDAPNVNAGVPVAAGVT
eukprot:CAMPEP_0198127906 /NCGR_PEP_ID=MMETSP1442-20131203/48245_1 /TAXON_ID= /ORGANISM="Craspedostauros australis, Strain CCMP3328" /LENGTH=156 /DNA_ID=CAMNT_0043787979 /DNA_START=87 /DNA_END=553 /DNA_ORIENTATION=-